MSDTNIPDIKKDDVAGTSQPDPKDQVIDPTKSEPSQNPIDKELEKIKNKDAKTQREKLLRKKHFIEQDLAKLDEEEGVDAPLPDADDETPLTVGMFKKLEKNKSQKTALALAEDDIQDEKERELVKYHLTDTIKPSGNPKEDLKAARAIVNSVKNAQIAQEASRTHTPKSHPSGSGAPAKIEDKFEPTSEEAVYMRPPFNLSKDQILAARKLQQSA